MIMLTFRPWIALRLLLLQSHRVDPCFLCHLHENQHHLYLCPSRFFVVAHIRRCCNCCCCCNLVEHPSRPSAGHSGAPQSDFCCTGAAGRDRVENATGCAAATASDFSSAICRPHCCRSATCRTGAERRAPTTGGSWSAKDACRQSRPAPSLSGSFSTTRSCTAPTNCTWFFGCFLQQRQHTKREMHTIQTEVNTPLNEGMVSLVGIVSDGRTANKS